MKEETAVVIIGGGVIGTSIAYHLTQNGCTEVILLEKNALASGCTDQAAGLVGQLRATPTLTRMMMYSVEVFTRFQQETGHNPYFRQVGSLRFALTREREAEFRRLHDTSRRLGLEIDFISTREAQDMVPFLQPNRIRATLYCPSDGYIDPHSLTLGFAQRAEELGARIYTHTPVTGIERPDGQGWRVITPRGEIETRFLVNAAGPWAGAIAAMAGIALPIMPVRHQAYVTVPLPGVRAEQPTIRVPDASVYLRPEGERLLFGGFETNPRCVPLEELSPDFAMSQLNVDMEVLIHLAEGVIDDFPLLQEARIMSKGLCGLTAYAPDGEMILGEVPQAPGFIQACALEATGIQLSPAVGCAVTELILEGKSRWELSSMVATRFDPEIYRDPERLRRECEVAYSRYYALSSQEGQGTKA